MEAGLGKKKSDKSDDTKKKKKHKKTVKANAAAKSSSECTLCSKEGHQADKCYMNPDSSDCRLPKNVIDKIKGISKAKKSKLVFGGSAICVRGSRVSKESACLDSGATHTMFTSISH